MRNVINNKMDKKIIIFITAYERKKKKRKKKNKLSEDFGLGYRNEHSHDYAGSTLFNYRLVPSDFNGVSPESLISFFCCF